MIERIDGDVTALSTFFSQFVIQVVGNALLLVGILALLFREDWRVGLAMTGFVAIAVVVLARFRNLAVPHWKAERQASAELFGFLEERLAGTEEIRSNGAEAYVMRGFYRLMRELLRRSLKAGLMINILFNTTFLLFTLGNAAAFAVGAWLFQARAITIGSVYIIFYYTNMLERPIQQIIRQMEELQKAGASIIRVRELLSTPSKLLDGEADPSGGLPTGPLAVQFEGVSFGYADGGPASGSGRRPGRVLAREGDGPPGRFVQSAAGPGAGAAGAHRQRQDNADPAAVPPLRSRPRPGRAGRRRPSWWTSAGCRWPSCAGGWAWSRRTSSSSTPPCATT